jgi:hypothetical protein
MAEEHPESPTAAARTYIAGIALACAFRAVEHYEYFWNMDSIISAGLAAMLTIGDWKLPWILKKAGPQTTCLLNQLASDPRWWVGSIFLYLLIGTFSPFIEQWRLPFSVWSSHPRYISDDTTVVSKADYEALGDKLENMTDERNELKNRMEHASEQITILQHEIKKSQNTFEGMVGTQDKIERNNRNMVATLKDEISALESALNSCKHKVTLGSHIP